MTKTMTRHLCIGLNYEGTQNQLGGCENDAQGYHSALRYSAKKSRGELLDGCSAATLRESLSALAAVQTPADTFYLTFSGHGTTVASATGPDGKDECLVLWSEKTGFELVKDDDLRRWLEAIPGTVVCIFDRAFRGAWSGR